MSDTSGSVQRDSVNTGTQRVLCAASLTQDKGQEVGKRQWEAVHNGGTVCVEDVTMADMRAPNNTA